MPDIIDLLHKYFILSRIWKQIILVYIVLLLAVLLLFKLKGKISIMQLILWGFLGIYIFLIFVSTVLTRISYWNFGYWYALKSYDYKLWPFYSYVEIATGNATYIQEVLLNTMMLFPVGLLLPVIGKAFSFKKVLMMGIGISLSIELLQLIFKCGTCETDDLFHNVLGCALGFWCCIVMRRMIRKRKLRNKQNL